MLAFIVLALWSVSLFCVFYLVVEDFFLITIRFHLHIQDQNVTKTGVTSIAVCRKCQGFHLAVVYDTHFDR